MEKYYRFAGVELLIDLPDDKMYTDEMLLEPFRVDRVSEPHCFRFSVAEQLDAPVGECVHIHDRFRVYQDGTREIRYFGAVGDTWEKAYGCAVHQGKDHRVQLVERRFPDFVGASIVMNCLAAEHLVVQSGGIILHSSFVDVGGKAVLFTAPSGTGKSTQAALWEKLRGAAVINGDRTAIRFENNGPVACGIPYAGSSWICHNISLPLAAVVYLSQSESTTIQRLSGFAAFRAIWEGCSVNLWNNADIESVSAAVEQVAITVPVYHLACRPDESAVLALEGML